MNDKFSDDFWEAMRRKAIENAIPLHGHFELTPRCNFNCKMCYIHLEEKNIIERELTLKEWIHILDEAIDNGMIFASLTGGECLLSPYFKEIYLYLQSKGILINVLTNGYLLSSMMDFFVSHPPRMIQVSVYGNNEDEYENVTGIRAYGKISESIDEAIENKLPICISVTPNKYLTNVIPIIKKYHSKGVPGGVAEYLIKPRLDTGRNECDCSISIEDSIRISKELSELNGLYADSKREENIDALDSNIQKVPNGAEVRGVTCVAGRCDFTINWTGEMMMCASLDSVRSNVLTNGFSQSWAEINEAARNFLMPIECPTCKFYSLCTHCPANHLSGAELGHCNPMICSVTKELVKMGIVRN